MTITPAYVFFRDRDREQRDELIFAGVLIWDGQQATPSGKDQQQAIEDLVAFLAERRDDNDDQIIGWRIPPDRLPPEVEDDWNTNADNIINKWAEDHLSIDVRVLGT